MVLNGEWIAFVGLATLVLLGILNFLSQDRIVHRVMAIALTFLSMAGLFVLLGAPFIAGVQLLVYAGAVSIVMVFAVMLTGQTQQSLRTRGWAHGAAMLGCGLLLGVIAYAVLQQERLPAFAQEAIAQQTIEDIGRNVFGRFALGLELISLLLTVALIGAIVLAKKQKEGDA